MAQDQYPEDQQQEEFRTGALRRRDRAARDLRFVRKRFPESTEGDLDGHRREQADWNRSGESKPAAHGSVSLEDLTDSCVDTLKIVRDHASLMIHRAEAAGTDPAEAVVRFHNVAVLEWNPAGPDTERRVECIRRLDLGLRPASLDGAVLERLNQRMTDRVERPFSGDPGDLESGMENRTLIVPLRIGIAGPEIRQLRSDGVSVPEGPGPLDSEGRETRSGVIGGFHPEGKAVHRHFDDPRLTPEAVDRWIEENPTLLVTGDVRKVLGPEYHGRGVEWIPIRDLMALEQARPVPDPKLARKARENGKLQYLERLSGMGVITESGSGQDGGESFTRVHTGGEIHLSAQAVLRAVGDTIERAERGGEFAPRTRFPADLVEAGTVKGSEVRYLAPCRAADRGTVRSRWGARVRQPVLA